MPEGFTDALPLSRSTLDRAAADREAPQAIESAKAAADTRVVLLADGRALLAEGGPLRLALLEPADVPDDALLLWLGRAPADDDELPEGAAVLGAALRPDQAAAFGDGDRWADLRLTGDRLSARDTGLFAELLGLANWHRSSRFSPRTGQPTTTARGGWVRHPAEHVEESSGEHVFPRTDPAVIVAVVDGADRLLLASNTAWPQDRFSLVAGFVEPGESFEAAVRREVMEETSVRVGRTEYLGSQPWPFPASVMIGFTAWTTEPAVEAVADGVEIRETRWFTRESIVADIASGALRLPGRTSIARAIIEHWFGGPLDGEW